jgi:hypothetical protein
VKIRVIRAIRVLSKRTQKMKIETRADRLRITDGTRLVAGYIYRGTWRPYFYPLNSPHGNVVRGIDGSEHHNQYGLSLAYGGHGEGGSTNIWSDYDEPPYGPCGKILHDQFQRLESQEDAVHIVEELTYAKADGSVMCGETREMSVKILADNALVVDFTQHLSRPNDPGAMPFIFYARVADSMRLNHRGKPLEQPGRIEDSEGRIGEEATRTQHSRWCDYSGHVGTGWSGIALLNHPENPESPAPVFTRGYGVFNVTQHYPDTDRLTLRWCAYVHAGNATEGRVEAQYQEFINA